MTKKALATLIMVIILAILSGCRTLVASGSEARTDCGGQAGYESNSPLYEETIAESSRCEAYETAAQETIEQETVEQRIVEQETAAQKAADAEMLSFSYQYNGTIMGLRCSFELKKNRNSSQVEFTYQNGNGSKSMELEASVMSELATLCDTYHVCSWDGFDCTVPNLYDGEGFELKVTFDNKTNVSAKGYGEFPDGYLEFKRELLKFLELYMK